MQNMLDPSQLKHLAEVLRVTLLPVQETSVPQNLLTLFLTAKEVEGCSPKTIAYYESTLQHMTKALTKPYTRISSDDLREYLNRYENERHAGKVTIDNIRRIMSSFFAWLEDEDYIVKSPVRRIHRVKTAVMAKEVLSDENLETLRDRCGTLRDLAIVDILASTGMRVGELVGLNIADVIFRSGNAWLQARETSSVPSISTPERSSISPHTCNRVTTAIRRYSSL